jgi:sporadic carbohydrate cluster protein (TIGR04323 family)
VNRVRGYIFSRPFLGERVPQHVQNLVIRDYCNKQSLQYLLSATEYAMANSHLILQQVLEELSILDGIVFYSLFLLPEDKTERDRVINFILKKEKTIYFAVEGLRMNNKTEHERIENIWQVKKVLPNCLMKYDYKGNLEEFA